MAEIVVIHALTGESRATTFQHTLSFGRYSFGHNVTYINIFGLIPKSLQADVIVFTYEFLALRNLPIWRDLVFKIKPLIENSKHKVAMPQDDYTKCAVLDAFFVECGINTVFTPITRDLEFLYPKSLNAGVNFDEAFTGYFDEKDWDSFKIYSRSFLERRIDVGQRVRHLSPQFGTIAARKGLLAVEFARHAHNVGFTCDVSTRSEDVLTGNSWYEFLGNIKFTVSRKGGASLADPYGRVADRIRRFQTRHPKADFESVEKNVSFTGGRSGDFSAISPRLFESSALGVCQILEIDQYVEGLEPWTHYIPLEPDLSNLELVFKAMRDSDRCAEIASNSQDILLASDRFTYKVLIERILKSIPIEVSSNTQVYAKDTSESLFAMDMSVEQCKWVQSYVARAFIMRKSSRILRELSMNSFMKLDEIDESWSDFAVTHSQVISQWIEAFDRKQICLESLLIPWTVAKP